MTFEPQPELKGTLINLRPLKPEDYEALFSVASDPLIWEQHPVKDRCTDAGFKLFFQEALNSGGALVVRDNKTGKVIGSSRYHGYDPEKNEVEIGWTFLARVYWGGTYNAEMKTLMIEHAFKHVTTVVLLIGPDNLRSRRAAEKIGAHLSGSRLDGEGRQSLVYAITKDKAL